MIECTDRRQTQLWEGGSLNHAGGHKAAKLPPRSGGNMFRARRPNWLCFPTCISCISPHNLFPNKELAFIRLPGNWLCFAQSPCSLLRPVPHKLALFRKIGPVRSDAARRSPGECEV
jgi:hypothetical protein